MGGSAGGDRDQFDGHQFLFITLLIRSLSYVQLADPRLHAEDTTLEYHCQVQTTAFSDSPLRFAVKLDYFLQHWDSCMSDLVTPMCALISLVPSKQGPVISPVP